MLNLQILHETCIEKVYQNDYYVDLFKKTVMSTLGDRSVYSLSNSREIADFWNTFWLALPDNPSIHREPFYLICDICEYIFGSDE